jgi:hypothetical protein
MLCMGMELVVIGHPILHHDLLEFSLMLEGQAFHQRTAEAAHNGLICHLSASLMRVIHG